MSTKKTYLPTPTKGAMAPYKVSISAAERHRILDRLVRQNGYATTIRDINLRATMLKNESPTSHDIMRRDMNYLQKKHNKKSIK